MKRATLAAAVLMFIAPIVWTENPKHCLDTGPPSTWVVKSPYPFQAGSEESFDELYHGPWRAQVDIVLYATPRSQHVVGKIKRGTVVQALLGESIVVHPLRFIAAHDYRVDKSTNTGKPQLVTMRKGDVFWVLDSGNEGEFAIWWHCSVVGWDSTEPPYVDQNRINLLGTNEERWVKIGDPKTGLSGWFNDDQADGAKLIPAKPTTKSTG